MTITKRDLISPEEDQRIMTELREHVEALIDGRESPAMIAQAIDRCVAWASYESRREKNEAMDRLEVEVRPEWHARSIEQMGLISRVLSPHERKRERWALYAAAGLQKNLPKGAAAEADMMMAQEESRFGESE